MVLFDTNGAIVSIPDVTATLASARDGSPLAFIDPANTAGFYLQIQNAWRARNAESVTAQLDSDVAPHLAALKYDCAGQ
ncbi:MAG: hypothetical protein WBD51_21600 [Burkholderiaceae bacterium]